MHAFLGKILCALAALVASSVADAQILFVNAAATGATNGTSWADAFNSLQEALGDAAVSGGSVIEIWVAAGTYMPDGGYKPVGRTHVPGSGNRLATFQLLNSVGLYGGFAGWETELSQRDITANETILSGDLLDNDTPVPCTQNSPHCDSFGGLCADGFCIISANNAENSYHVVRGDGTNSTAKIDGVTITSGNAEGGMSSGRDRGGGMYNPTGSPTVNNVLFHGNSASYIGGAMSNFVNSNPTVINCTFQGNSSSNGGGVSNWSSNPTVADCTFVANTADSGGGMHNRSSNPTVTDCGFSGNSAESGGGISNINSSMPTIINSTFNGNRARLYGGGMYNDSSSPAITHSSFNENSANTGGGVYNWWNSSPDVRDCRFSGNSAVGGAGMANLGGSSAVVARCSFERNVAQYAGGGMGNDHSTAIVTGCVFRNNHADLGGAMFNQWSSPIVANSRFNENSAGAGGGVHNIYGSSAEFVG